MRSSSPVRTFLKRTLLQILKKLGHDLDPISLEGALARIQQRGLSVQTVIDIGASDGRWTEICWRYFPEAFYFLVEAQAPHAPALVQLKRRMARMDYVLAAAGDAEGEIYFESSDLFGGLAAHTPFEKNCIRVPMVTIDQQVQSRKLAPPFLLKLDTHGFEIPILNGAQETLKQTNLLIIETYNFKFRPDNLRFHEMCAYLEAHNFRCIDLSDPLHRLKDQALWQFDLFFIPASSSIFDYNFYQ